MHCVLLGGMVHKKRTTFSRIRPPAADQATLELEALASLLIVVSYGSSEGFHSFGRF